MSNLQVVRKLKAIFGNLYTEENVCISGTHTHSGPGGFYQYVLYQLSSPMGFVEESLDVVVDGIVESIKIGMPYSGAYIPVLIYTYVIINCIQLMQI